LSLLSEEDVYGDYEYYDENDEEKDLKNLNLVYEA